MTASFLWAIDKININCGHEKEKKVYKTRKRKLIDEKRMKKI